MCALPTEPRSHLEFQCDINCFVIIIPLILDGWLRMGLLPPLGNFADISYLVEN